MEQINKIIKKETKLWHHKRIYFYFFSFLLLFINPIRIDGFQRESDINEIINLKNILAKCAEYCKRLDNSSLFFVCEERVKEVRYHPTLGDTNVYVYDYQLTRKNKKITEKRILIKENGLRRYEKDAKLKTKLYYYKKVIFGPYGLLSEFNQKNYVFKVIKEGKFKDKEVIVIEAVPKSGQARNDLFGKIWVARTDSSILKIEWNQESIENFEMTESIAKILGATPQITIIAEYSFENNGIRFPSEFSITEAYIGQKSFNRILRSKTTVTYKDYKFFTVETEVKH